MGDLLAEIRAEGRPRGDRCQTGAFLAGLSADHQDAVTAAVAEGIHGTTIARWLHKQGLTVGTHSVLRHLRRECSCRP